MDRLDEILEIVKNADNKENEHKNIILKASYLMGGLAWSQPFSGSNKRTATPAISSTKYLGVDCNTTGHTAVVAIPHCRNYNGRIIPRCISE